jgi:hypothetical protein
MQPLLLPDIIMTDHRPQWSLTMPDLRLMTCGRWALSMRPRGSLLTPEKTARTAEPRHADALRQVLAQEPVGVLVSAALPRVVRPRALEGHLRGRHGVALQVAEVATGLGPCPPLRERARIGQSAAALVGILVLAPSLVGALGTAHPTLCPILSTPYVGPIILRRRTMPVAGVLYMPRGVALP